MISQIVNFETAKLAKIKGYDWCDEKYNDYYYHHDGTLYFNPHQSGSRTAIAPAQSMLQKWLREKHYVAVIVDIDMTLSWVWKIIPIDERCVIGKFSISKNVFCDKYESALEDGLIEALKLL